MKAGSRFANTQDGAALFKGFAVGARAEEDVRLLVAETIFRG